MKQSGFPMSNKYLGPARSFKPPQNFLTPQAIQMQPQIYKMQPPAQTIKPSTQVHQQSTQLQPATTQVRSPSMVTSTTTIKKWKLLDIDYEEYLTLVDAYGE